LERISIEGLAEFDALVPEWDVLRREDPHATVFLSSAWLRAFLSMTAVPWRILGLRDAGRLVAALPISIHGAPHRRLPVGRELTFAAAPFADYQGMLCLPAYEAAAVDELAAMLRALPWERADFNDVRDPRVAALVAKLADGGMSSRELAPSPCSAIDLPTDWTAFLATLSKPTRRATLRPFKVLDEQLPGWHASSATAADAAVHIDAALDVNALRWGMTATRRTKYRRLFEAAFARGCARIDVVWDGARPIAAGVSFLDLERGSCGLYLVGYDPEYARFSPGKAVLATLVREAIALGCRTFDFMRGGESYKQSYATQESANAHYVLRRGGARAALLAAVQPGYAAMRHALVRLTTPRRAA
jgi:CelD/BcsL family acetyltransferase involved in cellulose biosynthesis